MNLRDMDKAKTISAIGHLGVILWAVMGDWLFAPKDMPPMEAAEVSLMSEGEFQAMMASAPKPDEAPTCAHFVIGQDGYTIQVVHLDDVAQHAHAASEISVGIELCAREPGEFGPDDPGLPPSPAQLQRAVELGAWLCRRLGLAPTRARIRGHAEVDRQTTHTGCPTAAGVDLDALATAIAARLAAAT